MSRTRIHIAGLMGKTLSAATGLTGTKTRYTMNQTQEPIGDCSNGVMIFLGPFGKDFAENSAESAVAILTGDTIDSLHLPNLIFPYCNLFYTHRIPGRAHVGPNDLRSWGQALVGR